MMKQVPRKRNRGARGSGAFELVVSLIVIAILAGVLLDRLAFYRNKAEVLAAQKVVANIRLSLRIRSAQLLIAGNVAGLKALAEENPVLLLEKPPGNYLGELDDVGGKLPNGNWFYQKSDKLLVYLLNYGNFVANEGQKSLKFKVKLLHWPKDFAEPSVPPRELSVVLEQVDG